LGALVEDGDGDDRQMQQCRGWRQVAGEAETLFWFEGDVYFEPGDRGVFFLYNFENDRYCDAVSDDATYLVDGPAIKDTRREGNLVRLIESLTVPQVEKSSRQGRASHQARRGACPEAPAVAQRSERDCWPSAFLWPLLIGMPPGPVASPHVYWRGWALPACGDGLASCSCAAGGSPPLVGLPPGWCGGAVAGLLAGMASRSSRILRPRMVAGTATP
jgi:hypothetical protein